MTVSSETIAHWQSTFEGTMIGLIGFTIVSASKEMVVAEVPYGPHLRQVTGLFHAGAILTLADSTATTLANLLHRSLLKNSIRLAFRLRFS